MKNRITVSRVTPEMMATTVSWAIYGAAKEWVRTPNRCPSEQIVETVVMMVTPMLTLMFANQ